MASLLKRKDKEVLTILADFRILSISQLTALCFPSRQMARRRIRELFNRNLVEVQSQDLGSNPGRSESLVSLTDTGIKALKRTGSLVHAISTEDHVWRSSHRIGHQLSVNWIRIHLDYMAMKTQDINVSFLSPAHHSNTYRFAINDSQPGSGIIPDGIFSIGHRTLKKALFFFLEVDMGTETLSSASPGVRDIRKKILSYQEIFRSNQYKQLECHFSRNFRGFRTLFVAHTASRQEQLSRLVRQIDSTDFVWLTNQNAISSRGMSGAIWAKGGHTESGLGSILGPSMVVDNPIVVPR